MNLCRQQIAFALIFALCASSVSAAERVRIMTFNAEFLAAPGTKTTDIVRFKTEEGQKQHCEGVAAVIEAFDPDIINLCEVTNTDLIRVSIRLRDHSTRYALISNFHSA